MTKTLTRDRTRDIEMPNTELVTELESAEAAAWFTIGNPSRDMLIALHSQIKHALDLAKKGTTGSGCKAPNCGNMPEYRGSGPYPDYCSATCRQRAHRAAKRQREGR